MRRNAKLSPLEIDFAAKRPSGPLQPAEKAIAFLRVQGIVTSVFSQTKFNAPHCRIPLIRQFVRQSIILKIERLDRVNDPTAP